MLRQVEGLAADLGELADSWDEQVRALRIAGVRRVVLTGNGDSYHAALCTAMAFETIAGLDCEPANALRFLEYDVERLRRVPGPDTLVVAVSASGHTEGAVQAIARAAAHGARTLAITSAPDSPAARTADHAVVVALPDSEASPGIRSYAASLVGLLLLAIRLGESSGTLEPGAAGALRAELTGLAGPLADTVESIRRPCAEVAEAVAEAGALATTGSGPSYGTARYAAAKVIEAAGVLAVGQDLDEWCHVERFAYPLDMPVFVIAPAGRSRRSAIRTAELASSAGRRVVAVAPDGDRELGQHAWRVLPVGMTVREEFSVLLHHPFAGYLGSFLADLLGRGPFQTAPG